VAAGAVALTALVTVRQVHALRENQRLLAHVDANLLELNRYQAELTHRANHDLLTNLPNRAMYEQESRRMIGDLAELGALSVALIDLDDFKAVNDRLGHTVGDMLLVGVAQRLRACVRRHDIVARLGGDEFALLLPGLSGAEAAAVLDRVQAALSRPVHAAGHDLLVRSSTGLAEARPGLAPAELLRRADLAMYAAKERGKGRYAVYDEELEHSHAADAQLGAELRLALDSDDFSLVYQPVVHAPDGAWSGVEALVRWHHPQRGAIPPDAFIRIAERTGLIVPLGDWVLRTACRQAAAWLERHGDAAPARMAVNVSARQLREPGFAADVADALRDAGLAPARLTVEVTETAVFEGGPALDTLHALAGLGVAVALDDFGTGHSSLGLLRTCPATTLKLDRSFVENICGGTEESVIAAALIQITDGLHLDAVAEGVETAEQAETLRRLGYRYLQGYRFARPMPPDEMERRITAVVAA
jgi:diguanylate cyclase (GGDEF)-like protein